MKRFYVRGIAHTTKGLIIFQDRNLKSVKNKLRRQKIRYVLLYERIKRKGKLECWCKACITKEGLNEI